MRRLTLPVLLLLFLPLASFGESPDPKDLAIPPEELARARDLVNKLSSESFEEREDAQEELGKMGRLAMPALLEGLNSNPSPEVRFRCQALIPKAAQEDLQARLATFLADTEGKYQHDLTGWNEFKKIAGASSTSRSIFADLLKDNTNRGLVLAVAGPSNELGSLVGARKQELYQMRFPRTANTPRKDPTVSDVIALMFAESHVEAKFIPRVVNNTTIYTVAGLNAAVSDGTEKGNVYKSILGRWIETRDDAISMYTAMNQATTLGLTKQAGNVAAKLIQAKGGAATYRMYAAFAIAKNGAVEHLAALESAFNDDGALVVGNRVVNGVVERTSVQVKDMALAAALLLTKQKPEDFGFTQQYKNNPGMEFTYSNWRITDEKRKEAFDKWKAWREKNKDFGKVIKD